MPEMFNPNGTTGMFMGTWRIISQFQLLTIILAGAAVIREREHGTLDHLLAMPLTPFEIAMAKVWRTASSSRSPSGLSRAWIVLQTLLGVTIVGSIPLFMAGVVLCLFFATARRHLPRHGGPLDASARAPVHSWSRSP